MSNVSYKINIVVMHTMTFNEIKKCRKGAIAFYVREPRSRVESKECMDFLFEKCIGSVKISGKQRMKLRRMQMDSYI